MSASQRVSHGFHRLALFLATIVLIVGAVRTLGYALQQSARLEILMCAHEQIASNLHSKLVPDRNGIDLTQIGCPDARFDLGTSNYITYGEARNPPEVPWVGSFGKALVAGLVVTLVASLAVYGLTHAVAPNWSVTILGPLDWRPKFLIIRFRRSHDEDDATVSAYPRASNEDQMTGPDSKSR